MKLYEKLSLIQQELKAPKNQKNTFGNYKYRSCEDILEAVKPLLAKNKATLILNDELLNIGDRYYVKATATFIDNESGDVTENSAFAREEETKKGMDGSQITGSSSSYARKYALNGLFLIDDVKDSDSTNDGEVTKEDLDTYKLTFGKHIGKTLKEVPTDYLQWLYGNDKTDEYIKDLIKLLVGDEFDKPLAIQEGQKQMIKDMFKEEEIIDFVKGFKKTKLSDLSWEQANQILGGK